MSESLTWWVVSAGTEDGTEGEEQGRVRATTEERARELYLSQRPVTWVIFDIRPGDAPAILERPKLANG